MKKTYTFAFIKTVTGKVTVTASTDEDASNEARDFLEADKQGQGAFGLEEQQDSSEVKMLDLKDVEPSNQEPASDF